MKNKKQIVITVSLIVVLILAVIGISYAAFSYVGRGEKVNQITTGTISMDYTESDNIISINNALPTTDETGKVRLRDGEYFDFSVTTNLSGEAVINWEIAAEDFIDNTFDGSNVKFYLTKIVGSEEVEVNSNLPAVYNEQTGENKKTGRPASQMSLLIGSTSTQGEETTNYRLRLYVDENYNPQGDGGGLIFKTRINVYGKVSTEKIELPVMKTYNYSIGGDMYPEFFSNEDYHSNEYRTNIKSITVKNDTNIPTTAIKTWDVSEGQDESVIAYIEEDGISEGQMKYHATIGGNGGVKANQNSAYLFCDFKNLQSIDVSALDTSAVTNMEMMFTDLFKLETLDLSTFNTSNVENMAYIFYRSNLKNLNISNFDTSKVKNMQYMFGHCQATNLDVSSFNTSKVTNMSNMFEYCRVTTLNLSNFDTSNVINMSRMFDSCANLTTIDVSKFNTVKVTDMSNMFNTCFNLLTLELTSFSITNTTKMSGMFAQCEKLTSILVNSNWSPSEEQAINMFNNCGTDHVTIV